MQGRDRSVVAGVHDEAEVSLAPAPALVAEPVLGPQPRRVGEREAGHAAVLVAGAEAAAQKATDGEVAELRPGRRRLARGGRRGRRRWRGRSRRLLVLPLLRGL